MYYGSGGGGVNEPIHHQRVLYMLSRSFLDAVTVTNLFYLINFRSGKVTDISQGDNN